jgi:hypothetical protein
MTPPKVAWVVFDLSNGDCGVGDGSDARNYAKWFKTRKAARAFVRFQKRRALAWTPYGPVKYVIG